MRSHIDSTPVADHFSLSCWYINSDSGMFSVLLTTFTYWTIRTWPGVYFLSFNFGYVFFHYTSSGIIMTLSQLSFLNFCLFSFCQFRWQIFSNSSTSGSGKCISIWLFVLVISVDIVTATNIPNFAQRGALEILFFFFGECSLYTPNWYPRLGDWRTTWNVPGVYVNRRSEPVHHRDKRPFTLTFTPLIN